MSEPTPDEYAAALDRLLDGLETDGPADAAVRADTDAIAAALGLIGTTLAAEAGGTAGATVVAMSGWRSRLNPRVLAAAAAFVVVLGVGIPVALSSGGSSSNDTAALDAPESSTADTAAGGAAAGAAVPGAPAPLAADQFTAPGSVPGTDTGTTGTAGTTTSGTATGATGAAPAPAADAAGGTTMDPKSASAAESKAAADATRQASTPAFEQAVACARAIVQGSVTAVSPDSDGRHLRITVLVEKWIAPSTTGPRSVTLRVLGPTMNTPGADESVYVGQRRLFVFGPSEDERAYAFQEPAWPETRQRIATIREERAGQGC